MLWTSELFNFYNKIGLLSLISSKNIISSGQMESFPLKFFEFFFFFFYFVYPPPPPKIFCSKLVCFLVVALAGPPGISKSARRSLQI